MTDLASSHDLNIDNLDGDIDTGCVKISSRQYENLDLLSDILEGNQKLDESIY